MSGRGGRGSFGGGFGTGLALGALGGAALGAALAAPGPYYPPRPIYGPRRRRRLNRRFRRRFYPYPVYPPYYYDDDYYYPGYVYSAAKGGASKKETCSRIRRQLAVVGKGVVLKKSKLDNDAGLGLFAARDFAIGEPVTEYYGRMIDWTENDRSDTRIREHVFAYWSIDPRFTDKGVRIDKPVEQIEGFGGGGYAQVSAEYGNTEIDFADCQENQRALANMLDPEYKGASLSIDPSTRVTFLRATRDIRAGEEIFIDE